MFKAGSDANILANQLHITFEEAMVLWEQGERPVRRKEDYEAGDKKEYYLVKVPPVEPKMGGEKFKLMLAPLIAKHLISNLANCPEIKIQRGKDAGKQQKNDLTYMNLPPDYDMWQFVMKRLPQIFREDITRVVNSTLATSGSEEGQFRRFVTGLEECKGFRKPYIFGPEDAASVIKLLQLNIQADDMLNAESYRKVKINHRAQIGVPWGNELKTVIPEGKHPPNVKLMLEDYTKLLLPAMTPTSGKVYTNSQLLGMDLQNPTFTGLRIKNKTEVIDVVDLKTKIRNYYVTPGHIAIGFSAIHELYNSRIDHDRLKGSWSMCGVSFASRGADDIMKRFTNQENWGGLKINALIYADDIHVAIIHQAKYYLMCLDVKHLDLTLSAQFIPLIQRVLLDGLKYNGKPIYDLTFANMIKYSVIKMFNSIVYLPYGLLAAKRNGANSGLPGITNIETMCTIWLICQTYVHLGKRLDEEVEPTVLIKAIYDTFLQFGLKLKEDSLRYHEIKYDQPHGYMTPYKILGFRFKKDVNIAYESGSCWINILPVQDLYASLIRPVKQFPSKNSTRMREKHAVLRCMGLCLSSGYIDDDFYKICKEYHDTHYKKLKFDVDDFDDFYVKLGVQSPEWDMKVLFSTAFPTQQWFKDIYTTRKPITYERRQVEALVVSEEVANFSSFDKLLTSLKLPEDTIVEVSNVESVDAPPVVVENRIENQSYVELVELKKKLNHDMKKESRKEQRKELGKQHALRFAEAKRQQIKNINSKFSKKMADIVHDSDNDVTEEILKAWELEKELIHKFQLEEEEEEERKESEPEDVDDVQTEYGVFLNDPSYYDDQSMYS